MQIGLVGLQFSGKTTLFNTLAGIEESVSHAKEEAAVEVVKVPDKRLDELTAMFNPKKHVNAAIEAFDFPGLKTAEDGKVRLTSDFLSNVRNNDAIFYVIRQFNDQTVPHPLGSVNPVRDIEFLETEFLFADLGFLENRIEKLKKEILKIKEDKLKRELSLMEKLFEFASLERPLRELELDESETRMLSGYQLLTLKPLAIAVNFDEASLAEQDKIVAEIKKSIKQKDSVIIPFSAKIENELVLLSDEDRLAFMGDYGITESALNKILRTSYELLGLQSFFTVGEDECRAWTIKKNYTAQMSAGVIHTDFFNKFIRAEVVHYEDFLKHGSFAKCKDAGVWRLEGKEYIVKDGDILNIRHS